MLWNDYIIAAVIVVGCAIIGMCVLYGAHMVAEAIRNHR